MSIVDKLKGTPRNIPQNATFRITQLGSDRLLEFSGDNRSKILVALETRGSSTIGDIAQESRLSRGTVERVIPALVRSGYVQYNRPSSADL